MKRSKGARKTNLRPRSFKNELKQEQKHNIKTLVFGAWDAKAGAVGSVWDVLRDPRSLHQVEVISGVNESECAALLSEFFKNNR